MMYLSTNRPLLRLVALSLLVGSTGCATVGPDYEAPRVSMPDAWHQELTAGLEAGKASLETWWATFEDPKLTELLRRTAKGNLDLKAAFARIWEARARAGIAESDYFPRLDVFGDVQWFRTSEGRQPMMFPHQERNDTLYRTGIDSTWELDVFGGARRAVESADAALDASVEDYRDILVILQAEVALTYFEVRTLQARIAFTLSNIETQQGTLKIAGDRYDSELVPELDVRQAELSLAATESNLPSLRAGLARAMNRLGVLLGEHPGELRRDLSEPKPLPKPPGKVIVGLPATLLRQRPDIRRAERQLAARTARIGIATADLYPRFALFGSLDLESIDSKSFFRQSNLAYSLAPGVRWNIFDAGRIRNSIRVEEAATRQALAAYEGTVLLALEETENALVAFAEERERRDALARAVAAAARSLELVRTLYVNGVTDFQNVLDMQQALVLRQDQLAESEGLVVQNLVRVYKALGGGWRPDAASFVKTGVSSL